MADRRIGQIVDALYATGIEPDDESIVRWTYSGRGMYGGQCFGIVVTMPELMMFVASLCEDLDGGMPEWVTNVREDDMGLGRIFYWPEVRFERADLEEAGMLGGGAT